MGAKQIKNTSKYKRPGPVRHIVVTAFKLSASGQSYAVEPIFVVYRETRSNGVFDVVRSEFAPDTISGSGL